MKIFSVYFIFFCFILNAQENQEIISPKTELRGVFIPSISNISWPTNKLATPKEQQIELLAILDDVKTNGYNTVFLQVRPENDALYASEIVPWSYWLTGTQGKAPFPFWDPLEFAVREAHARGLDLHAWLNPYRVKQTAAMTLAKNNTANKHPNWVFQAKHGYADKKLSLKMLNPGLPEVKKYIVSVVEELANKYDIDGIHFDDYFYPYSGMETKPQDAKTYLNNNPNKISTIEDWRRENVNQMIDMVYDAIQKINAAKNKNIVFGVSPFGIWKSGTPEGIIGSSSYNNIYCDPLAWLASGNIDYLAPQLYWEITKAQDYISLSKWWNDQVKPYGKQLYISQAFYKMDSHKPWKINELQNQINQNRQEHMDATFGQIAYSYTSIKNNANGINTILNNMSYKYKAYAPPILGKGKDVIKPLKPTNIRFEASKILWDTPKPAIDGDLPVKYVVYAFDNENEAKLNIHKNTNILDIVAKNEFNLDQEQLKTKVFVVASLDKNNNEAYDLADIKSANDKYIMVNELITNPVIELNTKI